MVVDAALAHRVEGFQNGIAIGRLTGALPGAPQQFENPGLREFRCAADTPMELIDLAQQPFRYAVEIFRADRTTALRAAEPLQRLAQCDDILCDLVAISQ